MTDKVILVDGATGYIGSHLAAALSRIQGLKVRCLVRAGAKREDIEFLESLSVEIIQTDIVSMTEASAESVFSSVDCLVHLIGSIAPGKHQSFEQLHGGLTAEMLRYCEDFFVRKVVLVTACGTRQDSPSAYHRSKWQAEKAVSDSGLEHAILRPSLIVGRQVGTRDSKLVKRLTEVISSKPCVPLVNGGKSRLQPVFIGDVVEAIIACVDGSADGIIEIGGPEILSMKEFVESLGALVGVKPKIVKLSVPVGLLIAQMMEVFQEVPTLSKDQVRLSVSDNLCQTNGLEGLLGHKPTPLTEALATYTASRQDDLKKA